MISIQESTIRNQLANEFNAEFQKKHQTHFINITDDVEQLLKRYKKALKSEKIERLKREAITDREKAGKIINIVCSVMRIAPDELKVKSNKRVPCMGRFMCGHLLYKHTKLTLLEIGKLFGRNEHSSPNYWKKKHKDHIFSKEQPYCTIYAEVKEGINEIF